ncbi:putative Late embryogenesis abundant protein, LEA_2 subgroup [Helianthus debilis subsp. tardiflorus]|nr:putative Late embryogenesis abundant protein [Helianthus annuus]
MATPNNPTQNLVRPTRFKLVRLIVIVLLALIIFVGLTVLIIWLTIKPKKLVYSIDDVAIHNYYLSNANHLNATYNLTLSAYNPNKKVSIYYDKVDIIVLYDDETISRGTIDAFYQSKINTTRFKLNLASHDVALPDRIARDLKVERTLGRVELRVKLKTRIRFKLGMWKSRQYDHIKVSCAPLMVHFSSSSKGFQRTMCDVDF